MTRYPNSICEAHKDVRTSEPFCPICLYAALAVAETDNEQLCEYNRELTRQVEQLRAEREVDRKDAEAWRRSRIVGRCGHCHEEFESSSALIEHMGPGELDLPKCSFAPPSSSDPGRADTGREEK